MTEEQKRLIRWIIEQISNELHSLEQRLFYQVEVKMCEGGKVKPEFHTTTLLEIRKAKQDITNAEERLTKVTTKPL